MAGKPELLDQVRTAIRTRHLSHAAVRTTVIYTHVLNRGDRGVQSTLDTTDR
jgi:hypothetical protein